MHERESALREWIIRTIKDEAFVLTALAGDASFRCYYRLYHQDRSYVIMDAPPEKESLESFISIASILDKAEISVPDIKVINKELGFLLLSDLGDELLLNHLHPDNVSSYYQNAIQIIAKIQSCSTQDPKLPLFDQHFMLQEMALCSTWFFEGYLSLDLKELELNLIKTCFESIAAEISTQPTTFIHRDYHSRNLMLPHENKHLNLSVIDFQDAMCGPITYDLVSLLKDCYISWPREQVLEWVTFFYSQNTLAQKLSLPDFIRAFDLCGLQRHLKVLGIFSRLYLRDNKPNYLQHLPLVLNYVLSCCELYADLHPFFHFLKNRVCLP